MAIHHTASPRRFLAVHLARPVAAALALGLLAAVSLVACSDDDTAESEETETPPPTPAEHMCSLAKSAIEGCSAATACDQALVTDCAAVAGMLSDPYLAATADCIEAGSAPLSCLASSTGALAPTAAHKAFAAQFCSECLLGVPACEDAFFGSDPGSDTAVVGALVLPFGDELVDAIRTECATGLQCLSFPSCAQGVLAKRAIPQATIQCVVDNLPGGGAQGSGGGAPQGGGDCTVGH